MFSLFQLFFGVFIGIALGVVLALFSIVKLLEVIPFITIMLFVGLVLGSLPTIYKKAKVGKIRIRDIISFVLAIALLVVLPFINTTNSIDISYNLFSRMVLQKIYLHRLTFFLFFNIIAS